MPMYAKTIVIAAIMIAMTIGGGFARLAMSQDLPHPTAVLGSDIKSYRIVGLGEFRGNTTGSMMGNVYRYGVYYARNDRGSGSAYYNIGGQYATMTGTYGPFDDTGSGSYATLTIVGDERRLASFDMRAGEAPKQFNVNIAGVSQLRFDYSTNSGYRSGTRRCAFGAVDITLSSQPSARVAPGPPPGPVPGPPQVVFLPSEVMDEPAILHIYRQRRALEILPQRYDIYLDDVVVGRSNNNWKTTTTINTSGAKTIWADIGGRTASVEIYVEPGAVYYVRSAVDSETVDTGKTRTAKNRDGSTRTTAVTETLFSPILQLMDTNLGAREFNAINSK